MSLRILVGVPAGVIALAGVAVAQGAAPKAPLGLPPIPWPSDNPYSAEKVELGKLLYFDKRLSSDGTVACASCHAPEKAFGDGLPFSSGIKGQKGGRSAPTVINRAYSTLQFWDGRASSLEEQAKGPVANPIEMTSEPDAAAAHRAIAAKLQGIRGYRQRFERVFGPGPVTMDNAARAIATFERTVLSGNAPYDRYENGDESALNADQKRGYSVFFKKAACDACHIGFNFTDGSYANIGIGMDKPSPDLGRYLVTKRDEERGAFKTPTLREIQHTGPYMHDGRFKTLEEVVDHYDKGGVPNPWLDKRMKKLNLTPQDKKDLVEFLKALSGEGWQHIKAPTRFP